MLVPICEGLTLCVPLVAFVPLQALLAVQVVTLVEDHVSVAFWPRVMLVGLTVSVTVGGGASTETVADAVAEPSVPVQVRVKEFTPIAVGVTTSMPLVVFVPLHAPPAVQDDSSVEDQVRVE